MVKRFCIIALIATSALADPQTFDARDSLNIGQEPSADAREMLAGVTWQSGGFKVTKRSGDGSYDHLITFPSPRPSGDPVNDRVVMEWYAALGDDGEMIDAPGMVIVHILDGRMKVARTIAQYFSFEGIHSFVIHLPYYGLRRAPGTRRELSLLSPLVRQGAADVRRARDAVAVLPHVKKDKVGLQGTSLGGFVTTLAASIDAGYDPVFIMLAGADMHDMLVNGKRDAKNVREQLTAAGITGEKLQKLAREIEPGRIAHRLNPRRTWLMSASDDTVVPASNAASLGRAAKLDEQHHIWLTGDHYTVAMHLPRMIKLMTDVIHGRLGSDR